MSRAGRINAYLPSIYRIGALNKLLQQVIAVLAGPIEEADSLLFRIQRAHRLNVAEEPVDIIRLAAALHLAPVHFEDITADRSIPFNEGLDRMRERVRRIARLHLLGLGTPWAVVESAAIFLDTVVVPERVGAPLIRHLDSSSHMALVEFTHAQGQPRERIYLYENPLVRRKVEPAARYPMDSWQILNKNFDDSPVILSIEGVGDRTVAPSIFCPESGLGVVFNGIIPEGRRLLIDAEHGARLDGVPVDDWLTVFHGAIHDFAYPGQRVAVSDEAVQPPFNGDLSAAPLLSGPKGGAPTARRGPSTWYFRPAPGIYDGSTYDFSVLATPAESIGFYDGHLNFNQCVFYYPPSGVAGMAWDESVACAFKLLLPNVPVVPASTPGAAAAGKPPDVVGRVARFLPRFRAAGVRAFVDVTPEAWILGESILRDPDATDGDGITHRAAVVRDPRSDRFVDVEVAA